MPEGVAPASTSPARALICAALLLPAAGVASDPFPSTGADAFESIEHYLSLSDESAALAACLEQHSVLQRSLLDEADRIAAAPAFEAVVRDALALLGHHGWQDSSAQHAARLDAPGLRAFGILMTLGQFARSRDLQDFDQSLAASTAAAIHLVALSALSDGRCQPSPRILDLIHELSKPS